MALTSVKAPKQHKQPKQLKKAAHKVQKRAVAKKATKKPVAKPAFFKATPAAPALFTQSLFPTHSSTRAFKQSSKLFADASSPSPAKILFQAQKFIQQDIESLSKELSPQLKSDIAQQGFSYTVNKEGVIKVDCQKLGFDVEFQYDREFEYADDQEEEKEENAEEEQQDEGKHAFHNITIQMAKEGKVMRLGGAMHLNGDLKINTFTPYLKDGTELRTVSTEDMSDSTVNAIFDALEVTALSDETCAVLLEIGRQERLKTHLESIDFIASFFAQGETM